MKSWFKEWETETLDVDFAQLSSEEDLGLDLAGGRDDPICPGENPVYISSINKVSLTLFLMGLKE